MTHHYTILFPLILLATACGGTKATTNPSEPIGSPPLDEKLEFNAKRAALTDSFSYRKLTWNVAPDDVTLVMGDAEKKDIYSRAELRTFGTSTQKVPTYVIAGFLDGGLATLDIVPKDAADCEKATKSWIKGLSIKYGSPAKTTGKATIWGVPDGTRIVVETTASCRIVYARTADTRVEMNGLIP